MSGWIDLKDVVGERANVSFTVEDLLATIEKLKVEKKVDGELKLLESDPGFWPGAVPSQAEYQEGMLDRKALNLPLNLWDDIED